MKNSFPMLAGTITLAVAMHPALNGSAAERIPENSLCIHVYNRAGAPQLNLQLAIAQTARVLARAGLRTSWAEPAEDSPEAQWLDLSGIEKPGGKREQSCLVVRIESDLPASQYPDAAGFAIPFARFGVNVEIFYRRVERQASAAGVGADALLAYTLTHEIGHVLLRSSEHTSAGIMRARWNHESVRLASSGMLEFLPEQAKQMRTVAEQFNLQEQGITAELNRTLLSSAWAGTPIR